MKLFSYNKSKLNLSIDIIMFLLLIPVAGIGFLMKYVLISGMERNIIYGNNVDLEFIGLTRHQWGVIHLTLSIFFLILLFLHIVLHWKIIVSVFRQMVQLKAIRVSVTIFLVLFCLLTLTSPFFLIPEQVSFEPKYRNRVENVSSSYDIRTEDSNKIYLVQQSVETEKQINSGKNQENFDLLTESGHPDSHYGEYEVYGYQTLRYISDKYNIPSSYLARVLNIPENLTGQKLGRLKRQYPFTMNNVRKSISEYKKQNEQ